MNSEIFDIKIVIKNFELSLIENLDVSLNFYLDAFEKLSW